MVATNFLTFQQMLSKHLTWPLWVQIEMITVQNKTAIANSVMKMDL